MALAAGDRHRRRVGDRRRRGRSSCAQRGRAGRSCFDRDVAACDDAIQVDVTDAAGVAAAVAEAVARLGGLDVLVNNAGIGAAGTVEDNSDEEWHRVYDVNVVGMVRVARAALPALRDVVLRRRSSTPARSPRPPASPSARSTAPPRARCCR